MGIRRIDHVGIVVQDLAAATAFFLDLGLELQGEWEAEGAALDRVVGLDHVRSAAAMLRAPDGQATIELVRFIRPVAADGGAGPLPANVPGLRHLALVVEDIAGIVARLRAKGVEPFGEIQDFDGGYRLCYIRGPEGIILELAERLA